MTTASSLITQRAVAPAPFAIGGVAPPRAARPGDRDELCEILRAATHDGLAVVPWGGGTAITRDAAPEPYDLAIDLGALDRVVEYEPEDLTLTAECGVTLATLRTRLAARGQELPLEGAHAARATLGGALAANASGARRRRFGGPRDRILGARFVLGDGTLVHTGGKVVKNVAGYGIHRMLCGSRGGLAIVVDASLKLLPAPAARTAIIHEMDAPALFDHARWAAFPGLEPAVLTVVDSVTAGRLPGATGRRAFWVAVGFEDDPARVAELRRAAETALGAAALVLADTQAESLWQSLADLEDTAHTRITFTSSHHTPEALGPLAEELASVACVFHAAAGRLHVFPSADRAQPLVNRLAEHGFALIDARGAEALPAIPPSLATLDLRRRIRVQLDAAGRFAPGARWERSAG